MKTASRAVTSSTDNRSITRHRARQIWLAAQGLTSRIASGSGAEAVANVVRHLGYVQIDTIHVIERCHHHILHTRLPSYQRSDLGKAQSAKKSVFEYWTHALAYVATEDYRYFMPAMAQRSASVDGSSSKVTADETERLLRRIADEGPISIRDIDDDVLVEKDHAWGSRKPSRRVLSKAFYNGTLTISSRSGMLKTYDLTGRHFGWEQGPEPAAEEEVNAYLLDRALRSQGIVSLDSVCYLEARRKPEIRALLEERVAAGRLVPVLLKGDRTEHWAAPEALEKPISRAAPKAKILSPFDPLVIQRKRLELFFGYAHRFEAYVPAEKRVLGYFALPVLYDGRIVAAIDMKTDRQGRRMVINKWTKFGDESADQRQAVDEALQAFEAFQLA
ncbi:YcaQ family DNA glycosylase [Rhizobium sp. KVB221]|uniref:YcaQ family DNA glycosylase n=1 Tax=Rhizobium setariae TaxID=2801340 RepID=A0A936YLL7_9HYPH|nr:crosslink repair DNA glycosylase YcaQ family protein [Rhizobium setariae]MBL0371808.1 YcaQ family DNA glycosylase [Rhizobium setariae]